MRNFRRQAGDTCTSATRTGTSTGGPTIPDGACRDVDTSRNGAKQLCSPACQSRVKAVAHRARRAAGA
ncbi:CGNR zinc finger domain-containing protein [Streptomyces sp. NBC_01283]|uniref:CGNR zinc finger domain-containing protein n=1 Tax=Streptomyces sp. NBC_01283 TaxID=2903812 RepID=UPI00352C20B9